MLLTDNEISTEVEKINKIKPRRWWMLWCIIGALISVAVLLVAGEPETSASLFETTAVRRGDIISVIVATGTVEPTNQIEVGTEVSGLIRQVLVGFNTNVVKGQILATLDTGELEAQVTQERANLDAEKANLLQAEATAKEARAKSGRVVALVGKGFSTQQDLDTADAALARAEASIITARARIAMAQASLDADLSKLRKAVVRAPMDGMVLDRLVEPGQVVAATFQTPRLFVMTDDLHNLILRARISEADIGTVSVGQHASFSVDAYPDHRFVGTIAEIRNAPRKVDGVVTYEAILAVPNEQMLLKPGMTATADITISQHKDVLTVSNAALRFKPPGTMAASRETIHDGTRHGTVWVQVADGQPERVEVVLGPSDGHITEIVDATNLVEGSNILTALKQGAAP